MCSLWRACIVPTILYTISIRYLLSSYCYVCTYYRRSASSFLNPNSLIFMFGSVRLDGILVLRLLLVALLLMLVSLLPAILPAILPVMLIAILRLLFFMSIVDPNDPNPLCRDIYCFNCISSSVSRFTYRLVYSLRFSY